jgi:hypothetical protein
MVRFNTDINEAEIYNANGWGPIGSPALFSTLPDGPGSLQANLGLKVNSLGTTLQFYTIVPNTTTFAALVDGPGTLQANMAIKVNSLGTALQFYTPISSFAGLTDGPGSLQANLGIQVNSSATALQYYTIVPNTTTFASLVDGPGSLHANLGIKVNSLGTALQYYTIASTATFASLTDGPGSLVAGMGIAVNTLGTSLTYVPAPLKRYRFIAGYAGQTYPSTVSPTTAPAGWSFTFGGTSSITITHNIGSPPLFVMPWSNNPSLSPNDNWVLKGANSVGTAITVNYYGSTSTTQFTLTGMSSLNMNTGTTGFLMIDVYFP